MIKTLSVVTISCLILLIVYFYVQKQNRFYRIEPYIRQTDKVLDFGCGHCCMVSKLKKKNIDVIGIDVRDEGTCYKPQLYNGYNIDYEDNTFDVTICNFVLHHIPHYMDILHELKRVTKRYLIITEDTPQNGIDDYFCKLHAGSDWGKCKDCFLSAEEWSKLFTERYGLKIVKRIDISRFEWPFAYKPFIYPVPATTFVLQTQT